MTLWLWILGACALAYLTKLSGYLVPQRVLESPAIMRISACMTVGLLASLVMMNAVADGQRLTLDSRVLALAAGVVALKLRAPFLVVVVAGAVAAALGRLAGLP
ncbi:branched-chain amino acid transporter AzlD [Serinicoccus sp. CNJ-927]|uniref:AzlD domain-containing protein n=1 Tax=Serinicoccus sp. CNJ-927 TaxID=1904970 RepID=UPI000969F88B|nr:AzlD domain-containing protein [Serinicoccus sp. CNJ-927]OLT42440.1 branched-chain amino acid transporter AzlD [Serinicoccus sp. CNJ-927]